VSIVNRSVTYNIAMTSVATSILHAIGHTPLVQLTRVVPAGAGDVLVKLESTNPTGSYKDRMALAMIEGAEARGALRSGMRVVEFTGGSTGSSLGMVCAAKGYSFVVLSSDAFAPEKLLTMTAFGADLRMVASDGGKVTPALFERFRTEIAKLAAEPNTFWTDQFHNTDALNGYAGIGRELLEQTGGRIDAFCGAVGTGGMLAGVARALREAGNPARIVALEPAESPAMTQGRGGAHRVEGIATGSIPPHMSDRPYDEARAIDEAAGREMARRLAREEGLLVGTSSGLNIAAAVQLARELGPGKVVATVAVDSGLKYLAGDLFQSPVHEHKTA
jgi:cysteine synthase A